MIDLANETWYVHFALAAHRRCVCGLQMCFVCACWAYSNASFKCIWVI